MASIWVLIFDKNVHARVERVMKMQHKMHLISTALAGQVKSQIYATCSCEVPPEPAKDKQLKAEGAQSDPGFSTIACSSNLQDLEQEMKKRVSLLLGREAKGACVVAVRAVRGLQTSVGRGGKNDMGKPECPIPSPRPLSLDGDYLLVAKKRKGHTCSSKYTAVLLVLKNFVDPEDQEKVRGIVGRSMPSLMTSRLESQRHVLTSRGGHPPCLCAVGKFGKTFGRAEVSKWGIQLKGEKNVDRGAQKSFLGLKMRKGAPGGRTVPLGCTTSANAYCKWRQTEEERVEGKKWEGCSNELKESILSLEEDLNRPLSLLAPKAFCHMEKRMAFSACGLKKGSIFTSCSVNTDTVNHVHKDRQNVPGGVTAIVSFCRSGMREEEMQQHALPNLVLEEEEDAR